MFSGDSYSNEEQEAAGDLWSKRKNIIYVWKSKSHNKCHNPKLTKSNQDLFRKG